MIRRFRAWRFMRRNGFAWWVNQANGRALSDNALSFTKQWLADEGPAYDLAHLQELLDGFAHHYNRERPHQGIANLTPAERFAWTPPAAEATASVGVDEAGEPVYPPHTGAEALPGDAGTRQDPRR